MRFVSFFCFWAGSGGFLDRFGRAKRFESLVEEDVAHGTFQKRHRYPPPKVWHFRTAEVSFVNPSFDEAREELS